MEHRSFLISIILYRMKLKKAIHNPYNYTDKEIPIFVQCDNCCSYIFKAISANKKSAIPVGMTDFVELLARFELATSSLPRV